MSLSGSTLSPVASYLFMLLIYQKKGYFVVEAVIAINEDFISNPKSNRKLISQQKANSLPLYYSPPNQFEPFNVSDSQGVELSDEELKLKSVQWVKGNLQLAQGDSVAVSNSFLDVSTGLYHCYMAKKSQGLEIVNSLVSLTMDKAGNVISQGNSWVKTDGSAKLVKRGEGLSCTGAVASVGANLGAQVNQNQWKVTTEGGKTTLNGVQFSGVPVTCEEKLYQTASSLKQVMDVTLLTGPQYLNVMVDKSSGKILGAADWTSHLAIKNDRLEKRQAQTFQYRAVRLGGLDPSTTAPELITNPANLAASPNGWHSGQGTTSGNNVVATENVSNESNPAAIASNGRQVSGTGAGFTFDNTLNDKTQNPSQYIPASITNSFFISNSFHDITYIYGFDEKSGNFQKDNGGKGGLGNDPVLAVVQDGSGKNNAQFQTPPDGQMGIMKMFVFDSTNPGRDGALENAVVIHELAHGLTSRLTGGSATANCLQGAIPGGLGEGWSDMVAMVLEMQAQDTRNTDKVIGRYVTGDITKGVRTSPYSTDMTRNSLTFSNGRGNRDVHSLGEIWATMLFEVYWNMVDKSGFSPDFKTNANGAGGNTNFLKVLINALKMQPCNPTFIQARDAMIAADTAVFKGAHLCDIFKGFAKRGLGIGAVDGSFVNDFATPVGC
ncbi:Fungalysin metallopeptidase-domain-containing protein [Globomyces pollinis-pini]|nr:Fungalysin metallopeptidase-domain-containing protein [Globomyces pollinis-pini]